MISIAIKKPGIWPGEYLCAEILTVSAGAGAPSPGAFEAAALALFDAARHALATLRQATPPRKL